MKNQKSPQIVRAPSMPAGTPQMPVCIVGGGSCGLTAAIALRKAGIEVLVLERDETGTGSSALSSGFIPAAETRLQKSLGIEDSHQLLIDDVMGELDVKRRSGLLPLLERARETSGQVFMTCTEENWPRELSRDLQRWEVKAGSVQQIG